MYKFGIKALIVGFLFQPVMPFCPQEVQSFYQVSWAAFTVAWRDSSSHTINAVSYFWKRACMLSFKTFAKCVGGKHEMMSSIIKSYQAKPKKAFSLSLDQAE